MSDTTVTKIPVGKIVSSTDRKYGGEGSIETLAQSIKEHGLIHPLAVKELPDKKGHYRVIAGRRRYEAVKSLGWKNVDVIVHDDSANDELIALAENVNREDMHPLDEAETFKRQMEKGTSVEEIAKYYSRSVPGIYQRIRLTDLIDNVKTMFRDGKINLSGAALIASLPESDQEKFVKKYSGKNVDKWELLNFMRVAQKMVINHIADDECKACKTRTHNTTPGLFENYELEDVCFNSDCYSKKWHALIGRLISEETGETENNIILDRGIPDFLPRKSKTMSIGDQEYTLLPHSNYNWKETNKKGKTKTAWLVTKKYCSGEDYKENVKVSRVTYEKWERPTYSSSNSAPDDPVKKFLIDMLPEIKPEEKKTVAAAMEKKHPYPWRFFEDVKETLLDQIISERLGKESNDNPVALYLVDEFSGQDEEGKWQEIDPEYDEFLTKLFGKPFKLSEIPNEHWFEKLFMFIIATKLKTNDMPDLNDHESQWGLKERSLFWKFAQVTREEYLEKFRSILTAAIRKETGEPSDESQVEGAVDDMEDPLGDE